MIDVVKKKYQVQFEKIPVLIKAPGRINLIGEHTDYNNGFVMPAAIDKAMYFAMGKSDNTSKHFIHAANYDETFQFDKETPANGPGWVRYLRAIIAILSDRGFDIQGINCVFGSDIPIGAGLSSSAALCCGFALGLSELFELNFSKETIARIAQEAEHRIGLNCGLMDQYAVLFGKEDHVFRLDCQDLTLQYIPMVLEHYSLVLIDSKIEHELEGSPYNDRRSSCEAVVALIAGDIPGITSLRQINKAQLARYEDKLDPLDYIRAKYVLEENERVHQMIAELGEAQFSNVGQILLQGHRGMSKQYDISLPEIDYLVQLAQEAPAVLGGRMMGGGFGGCTINLVKNQDKEQTLHIIQEKYLSKTNIKPEVYEVKLSDGLQCL